MGPPKVLVAPNPTSSINISTTFGAPAGGVTLSGHAGVESLELIATVPLKGVAGIGSTVRSTVAWPLAAATVNRPASKAIPILAIEGPLR